MVVKTLTDYTVQKNSIVTSLLIKQAKGLFNQNLHKIFNDGSSGPSKLNIDDVRIIIEAIELKLRESERICYTYFGSEYDRNILVQGNLSRPKIIDTEFTFDTTVLKNTIEINDAGLYRESINMSFQIYILTIASLYENLVRLIETLIKKRVVYGGKNPHISIPFNTLMAYWDNLIELDYRKNDEFYVWLCSNKPFLNKYLLQINTLRNSFIHGYRQNLEIKALHGEYVVKNHDSSSFIAAAGSGGFIPELVLDKFVNEILINTQNLIGDILTIFEKKLSHHMTKVPI